MGKKRNRAYNFSVAQEFAEVWDILDDINNKSKFICEAIIEKYQSDKNTIDDPSDLSMEDLTELINSIVNKNIEEKIGHDMLIVKGSASNLTNLSLIDNCNPNKDNVESVETADSIDDLINEVVEEEEDKPDDLNDIIDNIKEDEELVDSIGKLLDW